MKKTISIAALICLVVSLCSFTVPAPVSENENVKTVFKTDFSDATSAKWRKQAGFYFVDFTIGKTEMSAAYDQAGKLLGTSHFISSEEVPADILKNAEEMLKNGRSAKKVLEINADGQKTYCFTIISDKYISRCTADVDGVITEKPDETEELKSIKTPQVLRRFYL